MPLFTRKQKRSLLIPTLISKDCTITGEIKASALLRIDGRVNGDIVVSEGLIIGETGIVEGDIQAKELLVLGSVTGNIQAESVEIKTLGKVTGKIATENLHIERGAKYNGSLVMKTEESNDRVIENQLVLTSA